MFNRKVLVIAFMAVVLLTSFMDGSVSADGKHIHKRRKIAAAEAIMQTVPAMLQANLDSLMNQADGQDTLLASVKVRRHPRKRTTAYEPGVVTPAAYGISAAGTDTLLASDKVRKEPRKRRTV